MLIILSIFAAILISVLLLLCLKWTITISGELHYDEKLAKFSVSGLVGAKQFGIFFKKDQRKFSVSFGGRKHKLFSLDLGGTNIMTKSKKGQKRKFLNYPSIASSFLRSIQLKGLKLSGEFGLNTPAQTGKTFGALISIGNGLVPRSFDFNIQPNFIRQMINISGTTSIQLCPAVLAWRIGKDYFGINS